MPYNWKPDDYFRLFMSHLSEHHAFAGEMREWFKRFGISAFVAHEDIDPSTEWQLMIESALDSMDALLALLHPNFHMSRWCDQEIGIAIGKKRFVLSARLGADPHGFIGKYQAVSGAGKNAAQLSEEIAGILAVNDATARPMARGAVQVLRDAGSFEEAKRAMAFIEKIPIAEPPTIDLLESASQQNGQVGAAWGVPARIATVAAKWRA